MSSISIARAASQAHSYRHNCYFKIFPAQTNRAGAPKQPVAKPRAASDSSDAGGIASPAVLI